MKVDWSQLKSLLKLIILNSPDLVAELLGRPKLLRGAGPTLISSQHYYISICFDLQTDFLSARHSFPQTLKEEGMLCTLDVPIAVLDGVRWQIHPTCHFFAKHVASTVENKFKTMIYDILLVPWYFLGLLVFWGKQLVKT